MSMHQQRIFLVFDFTVLDINRSKFVRLVVHFLWPASVSQPVVGISLNIY